MQIQSNTSREALSTGRRVGRAVTSALLPLGLLVLAIVSAYVLEWTTALSLIGGILLIVLGAMWPILWLAAVVRRRMAAFARPIETRQASAERGQTAALPRLSLLVPARNERAVIGRMVTQLVAQTHADFEAIIIVNNCADDTAAVARAVAGGDPRILVLEATFDRGVKADAVNFALPYAAGDVIVQLDADNVVGPDFLARLAEAFTDPATNAVQTAIRAANAEEGILPLLQDIEFLVYSDVFNAGRAALGRSSSIGGTGFAIRADIIRALGGWSRHLVEDFELHLRLARAGVKVGYLGDVTVYDEKPPTWGALINQRRRWIRGHLALSFSPKAVAGLPLMEVVYLYSPLGIALSLALLCLGYASTLLPGVVPPYAYLSPGFWLVSLLLTMTMLFFVMRSRRHDASIIELLAYVFLFGFHWVVVLLASMLPASWANTKTVHGEAARGGLLGYLGVDGVRSGAVALVTLSLAALWLAPLLGAFATPEARSHLLSPIESPRSSSVAVLSVIENAQAAGTSSLGGSVTSAADGTALGGATLTLVSGSTRYAATTATDGSFLIAVGKTGIYTLTASKAGYLNGSTTLTLGSGQAVNVSVLLSQQHGGVIYLVPVPY